MFTVNAHLLSNISAEERELVMLSQTPIMPFDTGMISGEEFEEILIAAYESGASDTWFQTDRPVIADIAGRKRRVTQRVLTDGEIREVINQVYRGGHGSAMLAQGKELNPSFELKRGRDLRLRWRVNITPCLADGGQGAYVCMRTIPLDIPTFDQLEIEQEIRDNFMPRQGLVLITGPTGSGKSTLLAAGIRYIGENPRNSKSIVTYEAPIEFVYDRINFPCSNIVQFDVSDTNYMLQGGMMHGVENAMRQKPDIILCGEARDAPTMASIVTSCTTGHLTFSTVHSNGVVASMNRVVNTFPVEERSWRAIDLMDSMRMIVTQTLLPKKGGGRVAAREFLVFDDELRSRFMDQPIERWRAETRKALEERGQPMLKAVRRLYKADLISQDGLAAFEVRARTEARLDLKEAA
jgi:defect in organelle trafficking protein DotB